MFAVFGPGSLYLTRTDIANATPVNIGYAQEFGFDEDPEEKQLFGQNRYPLAVATATVKVSGKAKSAMLSGIALNALMNGSTFATGQLLFISGEAGTIPTTPFTITVANGATMNKDLGVVLASTGIPFARVASAPAANQYSVNEVTGVYTFNTADTTKAVLISYMYTQTTSGQRRTVVNAAIGTNPTFQLDYATTFSQYGTAKPYVIRVYNCICTKLSRNFKLSDFMMPEISFTVSQNAAGSIYEESYPEVS